MCLHKLLYDSQSEASPAGGASTGRVRAIEPLEDEWEVLRCDARSSIRHGEGGAPGLALESDGDSAAFGSMGNGVLQQIADDLGETVGVTLDGWRSGALRLDGYATGTRTRSNERDSAFNDIGKVETLLHEHLASGIGQ